MRNGTIILLMIALVVGVGFFVFKTGSSADTALPSSTGNVIVTQETQNAQKITLSGRNYNYYPETVKVKAGTPVELSLDSSVKGCLRAFTIQALGVSKMLRTPADSVVFTPQKGTYRFACSMSMGYGTLIAE